MKNWVLIETSCGVPRFPEFFDTYEEAFNRMVNSLAEIVGVTPDEVWNCHQHGAGRIDEYCAINNLGAYYDRYDTYIWSLFDMTGET